MKIYPLKITHDGKYDNDRFQPVGEIYLHGKLDSDNGYDLCGIKRYPKEDGIYDCEVMMDDGVRKAKLFYWSKEIEGTIINEKGCRHGKWIRHRGYVVQVDDTEENMQHAQKKFEERSEFL